MPALMIRPSDVKRLETPTKHFLILIVKKSTSYVSKVIRSIVSVNKLPMFLCRDNADQSRTCQNVSNVLILNLADEEGEKLGTYKAIPSHNLHIFV